MAALAAATAANASAMVLSMTADTKVEAYRWLVGAVLAFAVAAVCGLRANLPRSVPIVLGAALLVIGVVTPPQRSDDVWAYASYGRLVAEYHVSPYRVTPARYPADPIVRRMAPGWRKARSVYGPVFVAFASVGAAFSGDSPLALRLWFQALSAIAVVAVAVVLARGRPGVLALFLLNPFVIVVVTHEAHLDLLIGAAVLWAVLVIGRERQRLALAVVAFAALVKLTALVPLAALLLWVAATLGWRRAARVSVVPAAILAVPYLAVGGLAAVWPVTGLRALRSTTSIWHSSWLRALLDTPEGRPSEVMIVTPMVLVIAAVLAVPSVSRGDPSNAVLAAVLVPMGVYLATALYVPPWYGAAVVPSLFRSASMRALCVASLGLAVATIGYGAGTDLDGTLRELQSYSHGATRWTAVALLACMGRLLVRSRPSWERLPGDGSVSA